MPAPKSLGRHISVAFIASSCEESNKETLSKSKKNGNYHDDEEPKGDCPIAVEEKETRQTIFVFLANVEKAHAQQPRTIDWDFIFNEMAYRITMTRKGLKYVVLLPRKVAGHTKSDKEGRETVRS
uniref:Uncharacterized protein n=1 Tax=Glossina austeni TaxID=7395 RepID=A0A1A9VQH9_GLOAU